ncbi:MAG: hypothetical protein K2O34_04480, partial [Acetatifactor sp.]|nr:hypothetical protein [Acetatifactor sp.]
MKKGLDILITLCMLVCGIFFGLISGPQFVQLLAGSRPLETGEAFNQAEGSYIAYEAAYPVAEYVEKYYSGDPDREETMGYVVYDVERQSFICIVVPYGRAADFRSLMRGLTLVPEMRAGRDMEPILVKGSLEPMDDLAGSRITAVLQSSEIVEMYSGFLQDDDDDGIYLGDQYGEAMEAMCRAMENGLQQENWYYIESGAINGMSMLDMWVSLSAAVFSLLIFVFRLLRTFSDGKVQPAEPASGSGSQVKKLIEAQRGWVTSWCEYNMDRHTRFAYLTVVIFTALLIGIGFMAGMTLQGVLVRHLPMGLIFGELVALLSWSSQRQRSKPEKILEKLERNLGKELRSFDAQEDLAKDLLNTGAEWGFREHGQDAAVSGIVGSRYWAAFSSLGTVTVVYPEQLKKVMTETVSGQVRVGKVRTHYLCYT